MRLFRRPRTAPPAPDVAPLPRTDLDIQELLAAEIARADLTTAPLLAHLQRTRTELLSVTIDAERGSAVLRFDRTPAIAVATADLGTLRQLEAAARLTRTRLSLSTRRTDGLGRVLVFEAPPWTLYLPITIAVLAPSAAL